MSERETDLEALIEERHRWRATPAHLRSALIPKCILTAIKRDPSNPYAGEVAASRLVNNVATPEDFGVSYKATETLAL